MSWLNEKGRIRAVIAFILLLSLVYVQQKRWKDEKYKATINSDGRGYYAYLPACFIYHDLQFKFIPGVEKEIFGTGAGNYINGPAGKEYNKYFVGVAILESPFFFGAYLIEKASGHVITGYTKPFQMAISLAALFYLGLGLLFLVQLLQTYQLPSWTVITVLVGVFFGTNLFYYATIEPGMSHVYSFALIAAFAWRSRKFFETQLFKDLLVLALVVSMIVLIRPVNVLVVLSWPFLFGGLGFLKIFAKHLQPQKVLLVMGIGAAFLSLQAWIYYLEIGKLWIWAYQDELFYFNQPHVISILFGFRKGLFVYTPLLALSFFALWSDREKQWYRVLYFIGFFMILTYVLSCWWSWWYGGSFGLRAYIDFYPILIVPFALALERMTSKWKRIALMGATLCCMGLNMIQTEQYNRYILHMEYMNVPRYWQIFLSLNPALNGIFYQDDYIREQQKQLAKEHLGGNHVVFTTFNNFEPGKSVTNWAENGKIATVFGVSSQHACEISAQHQFSCTYIKGADSLKRISPKAYLRISAATYLKNKESDASLVVSLEDANGSYSYQHYWLKPQLKTNCWTTILYNFKFENIRKKEDLLKVYFYGTKGELYISDFKIELVE